VYREVSRRPPTVESHFRFHVSQREICGREIGIGSVISPRVLVFPCQYRGPTFLSQYTDSLRAGWCDDRIPVGWRDFLHPSRLSLESTQAPVQWVKRPGSGADHRPPSRADIKERVQLYLYSPSGLSWFVLGWTLPVSITPRMLQTHLHLHVAANRKTNGRSLGTFQKTMLGFKSGALDTKVIQHVLTFLKVGTYICWWLRPTNKICKILTFWRRNYFFNFSTLCIQGITGGTDQTSGECSLGQTIPI